MIIKIKNVMHQVKNEERSNLVYVDFEGQVTSGNTNEELIEKLKKLYGESSVFVYLK